METETTQPGWPHLPLCANDCGRQLLPEGRWYAGSREQRKEWVAQGKALHSGRGLCRRCYGRVAKTGGLIDFERRQVPADVVVEEWRRMDKGGHTRAEAARLLAPRLGMSYAALEKALDRAGVVYVPSAPGWTGHHPVNGRAA